MIDRLLVFFTSSFDQRRIDKNNTPYLYSLMEQYPKVRINNIPESDLIPTLVTGRYPHEHGIWQVRLNPSGLSNGTSALDHIPDILTTTTQCLMHLATGSYNLAAVPYWRRRRFDIYKTRYYKKDVNTYLQINGYDTLFKVLGENNCNYTFNSELEDLDQLEPIIFNNDIKFDLLEDYGLDRTEHWSMDNEELMNSSYKVVDSYIEHLHSECERRGITLIIFADHGMEPVRNSIDIKKKIKEMDIRRDEMTYFIEAPKARFWFHSDSAKEKMLSYLRDSKDGVLLSYQDMHQYNIKFEDDSFGEYYFVLNPGNIFFPNDYYHPIANIFLGLTEKQQRSRFKSPKYRGYHGYMPYNECEKGFMILLDQNYKTNTNEIETIDFAPTILNLLGLEKPKELRGETVFYK